MRKSLIGLAVMVALGLMAPRAGQCQVAQAQVSTPIAVSKATGTLALQVSLVVPSTGSYLLNTGYYLNVSGHAQVDAVTQVVGGGLKSFVAPATTEVDHEGGVAATDVAPMPMVAGSRVFVTLYLGVSNPVTIEPDSAYFQNQSALKAWLTPVH